MDNPEKLDTKGYSRRGQTNRKHTESSDIGKKTSTLKVKDPMSFEITNIYCFKMTKKFISLRDFHNVKLRSVISV